MSHLSHSPVSWAFMFSWIPLSLLEADSPWNWQSSSFKFLWLHGPGSESCPCKRFTGLHIFVKCAKLRRFNHSGSDWCFFPLWLLLWHTSHHAMWCWMVVGTFSVWLWGSWVGDSFSLGLVAYFYVVCSYFHFKLLLASRNSPTVHYLCLILNSEFYIVFS